MNRLRIALAQIAPTLRANKFKWVPFKWVSADRPGRAEGARAAAGSQPAFLVAAEVVR